MINKEETGHTDVAFREVEKKETLFYTTEEMFGTRGSMRLRWPPRHILVPLNGEKEGRRIIPYVAALAKTCKAKITLLTVGRPFQWSLATPSIPAPTTKALESRLIPFVMQLREGGADVDFKILRGEKSKVIRKLVNEDDTDLVILANQYRHSWLRYLQGIDFVPNIDRFRVPTFII